MKPYYPYSGLSYFRTSDSDQWLDWFDRAIGGHARSALVAPADELEAVLTYDFKTSRQLVDQHGKALQPAYYSEQTKALRPAEQIIHIQDVLAGLTHNVSFTAHPTKKRD